MENLPLYPNGIITSYSVIVANFSDISEYTDYPDSGVVKINKTAVIIVYLEKN